MKTFHNPHVETDLTKFSGRQPLTANFSRVISPPVPAVNELFRTRHQSSPRSAAGFGLGVLARVSVRGLPKPFPFISAFWVRQLIRSRIGKGVF